ncbi:SatD family protein [Poritiphilus flavus]|uniref:SatD family (SatD) n=1 Tax=Poritiphilus flavus TaxID=2697053 RepID=A0A6L9EAY1_9FLAO|nr:SatD family protein [Poritiphilus flavus]NAS11718.1 hypothetical protein [Poritiphilus flavus]
MIAVITGDIVNSQSRPASEWIPLLRNYFSSIGKTPTDWEIYRGDEFQLRVPPENALEIAIRIKAMIKTVKNLDVRIGIGLGEESFKGTGVSESNGTAYQRSGKSLELLKNEKNKLMIATADQGTNDTLNLLFKLALDFMDDWSTVSAEIVNLALEQPQASQKQIAKQLNIQQSAVSQRQKRARLDLVQELLTYYAKRMKNKDL